MTPALIFEAAKLWKAGCDTKQIAANQTMRKARVTEDDIYNRMNAIRLLARSLDDQPEIAA